MIETKTYTMKTSGLDDSYKPKLQFNKSSSKPIL